MPEGGQDGQQMSEHLNEPLFHKTLAAVLALSTTTQIRIKDAHQAVLIRAAHIVCGCKPLPIPCGVETHGGIYGLERGLCERFYLRYEVAEPWS